MTQNNIIHLRASLGVSFLPFANQSVIVTGQYDSCSKVLKVRKEVDVELLQ